MTEAGSADASLWEVERCSGSDIAGTRLRVRYRPGNIAKAGLCDRLRRELPSVPHRPRFRASRTDDGVLQMWLNGLAQESNLPRVAWHASLVLKTVASRPDGTNPPHYRALRSGSVPFAPA
jgi:hypothetical protein